METGEIRARWADCIKDGDFLVVILYHRFARSYHWGKLSKKYMGPLCIIFLQQHVNLQSSQNKNFN